MGIDIYMEWPKQTKAESEAQITGFDVTAGGAGYLREAYHGGPYVTQFLVQEAFKSKRAKAKIKASVMRARLPAAVMMALYRNYKVYEQGKKPGIIDLEKQSGDGELLEMVKQAMKSRDPSLEEENEIAEHFNAEQIKAAELLIETRNLPDYALSFVDFVRLAEVKEAEHGKPVTVIASY